MSEFPDDRSDLAVARRAAVAGAAVGLRHFGAVAALPRELKADGSVVTAADRAVESAVRAVLADERPADAVLGEEQGQTGDAGRRWIVDPIDGTALFVAGDDRWLVLVALERAGEIVAGVAALPAQDRVWWAARGGGAYEAGLDGAHPRPVGVDDGAPGTGGAGRPSLRAGIVPPAETLSTGERAVLAPLETIATPVPWRAHPGLLVAGGALDVAVQVRGKIWDYAATSLIVEEAGGRFSMADGGRQPASGTALYARDAATHASALRALEEGAP
jgi:histidinol-phosphatase